MLQGLLAFGESQKLQSYWRNGAFSEKILCPLENVYPIPEEVLRKYSVAKLSVMNSTLVPHGGLLAAGMEPGHVVMVQPATGHFGACGVAVSIAMGASVVYAVGRNKAVLEELVKRFGPRVKAVVVSGTAEDKKIYETLQVDVTLNFYPPSAPTDGVILGLAALKPGATLMLVGGSQDSIALPYWDTMIRNITVKGSFMYPPSAVPKHIRLVQAGLLDLDAFEEKSFKLDSVLDAVEFAASKENRGWLSSTVLEP
jgi:alcohol dehydrogenase